jgi:glutaminyl-tRNA synthetase
VSTDRPAAPESVHFIRAIIDQDNRSGKWGGQVVTRFPPEPNGYLHIGHAKSICLNFGLAKEYGGRCHLRMDDTNPTKEDVEYVESIQEDVRWLGFDWGEHFYFASDYFGRMFSYAEELILKGKAYVCFQTEEEMRATRGTVTEPGTPSPWRDTAPEDNLRLFRQMCAGELPDGHCTLRAKIHMGHANMKMRDLPMVRIRHAHHHRTGDRFCVYPLYDFAHCLSDSVEGITHSICTLEFENNRELYDWFLDNLDGVHHPQQIEFARLRLSYTVMSKRKLLALVKDGQVSGWDDPRMPTIAGLRRRGVTAESIREFAERIGVAKANSTVSVELFESCIRDDLNSRAPRLLAVARPLKVTLTNWPEGQVEELDAALWPHDVPKEGSRALPFSGSLFIERDDFALTPPKGWHRLAPGGEVRLRHAYIIRCDEVVKDDSGEVVELRCSVDLDTRSGSAAADRKVKGTIHWVSAAHAVPAELRLYSRLFRVEDPDAAESYAEALNPDSLEIVRGAFVEPAAATMPQDARLQFERQGYFWADPKDSRPEALVFNRIISLKDSWAKAQPAAAPAPAPRSPSP